MNVLNRVRSFVASADPVLLGLGAAGTSLGGYALYQWRKGVREKRHEYLRKLLADDGAVKQALNSLQAFQNRNIPPTYGHVRQLLASLSAISEEDHSSECVALLKRIKSLYSDARSHQIEHNKSMLAPLQLNVDEEAIFEETANLRRSLKENRYIELKKALHGGEGPEAQHVKTVVNRIKRRIQTAVYKLSARENRKKIASLEQKIAKAEPDVERLKAKLKEQQNAKQTEKDIRPNASDRRKTEAEIDARAAKHMPGWIARADKKYVQQKMNLGAQATKNVNNLPAWYESKIREINYLYPVPDSTASSEKRDKIQEKRQGALANLKKEYEESHPKMRADYEKKLAGLDQRYKNKIAEIRGWAARIKGQLTRGQSSAWDRAIKTTENKLTRATETLDKWREDLEKTPSFPLDKFLIQFNIAEQLIGSDSNRWEAILCEKLELAPARHKVSLELVIKEMAYLVELPEPTVASFNQTVSNSATYKTVTTDFNRSNIRAFFNFYRAILTELTGRENLPNRNTRREELRCCNQTWPQTQRVVKPLTPRLTDNTLDGLNLKEVTAESLKAFEATNMGPLTRYQAKTMEALKGYVAIRSEVLSPKKLRALDHDRRPAALDRFFNTYLSYMKEYPAIVTLISPNLDELIETAKIQFRGEDPAEAGAAFPNTDRFNGIVRDLAQCVTKWEKEIG